MSPGLSGVRIERLKMGKIVKYCSSCDEGFAEKFGFCPNCGAALQAFEMSPVAGEPPPLVTPEPLPRAVEPVPVVVAPEPELPAFIAQPARIAEAAPILEVVSAPAITEFNEPVAPQELVTEFVTATPEPELVEAPVPEPAVTRAVETKSVARPAPVFVQKTAVDADRGRISLAEERSKYTRDGGFYLTVIEEKNVKQRNLLLVGALGFMVLFLMSATVYSLFSKDLDVGSINDDIFNAVIVDDVPTQVEKEVKQQKDKDSGGGGGGGREEKTPASRGDLADQTPNPIRPPDVHIPKLDNPELVLPPASTQGIKKFDKLYGKFGDPNGPDGSSNGTGSGGGIGSGRGTGQGGGNGTGAGNGLGSGYGNGNGNGNGDGTGDGLGAPPPRPVGVTQGIKILSKPRPGYTDSARQANIHGTVILRVTFLASGQVGSISPVKGLGNGLTEQAIAAARRIAFEPAKTNGVSQSVTKQIEYTFSIY